MARKIAFIVLGACLACGALSIVALTGGSARADDAVLDQMLGDGMHAYFDNNFTGAYNQLSSAIREGSRDPRVYYFRGLAELQLGREPDAGADFEKGATFEATEGAGQYQVGTALERIQGPARHSIELFREHARAVAFQQSREQSNSGFANQANGRPLLLRHEVEMVPTPPAANPAGSAPAASPPVASVGPATAPPTSAPPAGASATPSEVVDPFGAPAARPGELPSGGAGSVVAPAAPVTPAVVAPSGVAPAVVAPTVVAPTVVAPAVVAPIEKPANADPFGGDAKPAEKPTTGGASSAPATTDAKTKPGALGGIFRSFKKGALSGASPSAPATGLPANGPAAPNPLVPPSAPNLKAPAAGGTADPFGNEPPPNTTVPSTTPATQGSTQPAAKNPFGDDATPPAKNAAKPGADTKPATPPTKKPSDDPFGN